jgi:hypothetical protein
MRDLRGRRGNTWRRSSFAKEIIAVLISGKVFNPLLYTV